MKNLFKNPRISFRAASDHDSVTAGLLHQCLGTRRICHIAVSDNRNRDCLFYPADDIPVCFSGIKLRSRSSMNRNCGHSAVLEDLRNFHSIRRFFIKALSNLYGYRLFHCLYHACHDFPHQMRILHKGRAFAVIDNLWHRTAHVKIQNIKRPFFDLRGNLPQNLRITAKKLQGHRMLTRIDRHQVLGIFILI